MKKKGLAFLLLSTLLLSSCSIKNIIPGNDNNSVITSIDTTHPESASSNYQKITEEFSIYNETTLSYISGIDKVYTITSAGEYTLKGKLEDGSIIIDASEDDEIIINLSGVSLTSSKTSLIYAKSASKVEISAKSDTYNEIIDNRKTSEDDSSAAIYALCDLKFKGKGNLYVKSTYNNGIHSKDDLEIKNLNLEVNAINNALKGNDSVTIESGNVLVISTGGDGIKTENSDISSKGNQRGMVDILGGIVDIYACEDGIDSAYDVNVDGDTYLNIYTSTYSKYSSTHYESTDSSIYLRTSNYNTNYRYSIYYYNNDGTYEWSDFSYKTSSTITSGNSNRPGGYTNTTYYYYDANMNSNYTNMAIFMFDANQSENSLTNYIAMTDGETINTSKNMYIINNVSGNTLNGDWSNYSTSADYSTKGIKTDNEINLISGNIIVESGDDAFHANYGALLENGNTGLGNINVNGAKIEVVANDDGMHADNTLIINSGTINIINAHECLEANQIKINGGNTKVYGTDDGINGAKSINQTPLVEITGGTLDVTVSNGDTDGIDSNGNYKQTGGYVITKNPTTDSSGNMGALDIDGSFTITGGTFIALGPVSTVPSNYNYVRFGSTGMGGGFGFGAPQASSSVSFTKGNYTVTDTTISFSTTETYYSLFIASNELEVGKSYTLSGGTVKTWTQSQAQTNIS